MDSLDLSSEKPPFNWEEFFFKYRKALLFLLIGLIFLGLGIIWQKEKNTSEKIEIIESGEEVKEDFIIAEISGAIEKAGVYKLDKASRIEDLIIAAGGVSENADRIWMEKYLNRASKLTDGQKVYIPEVNQQLQSESAKNIQGYQTVSTNYPSQNSGLININTASQKELESLWGIGPVYAQKIIEQRPYSNIEELLSKNIIKKNTYEKIKNSITIF